MVTLIRPSIPSIFFIFLISYFLLLGKLAFQLRL